MAKNLRELGAKEDAGTQLMMETSARIYEGCADDLIRAFQEETIEVQTLLSTAQTLDDLEQQLKTEEAAMTE